jgi:hypothetical protein
MGMETLPAGTVSSTEGHTPLDIDLLQSGVYSSTPMYGPGLLSWRETGTNIFTCTNDAMFQSTLTRLTFTDPDGTEHDFVDANSGGAQLQTAPVTSGDPSIVPPTYSCAVPGPNRGRVWVTRDGSFATFVADGDIHDGITYAHSQPIPYGPLSGYLHFKDGAAMRIVNGNVMWSRDRNGNLVSYTYATDVNQVASFGRVTSIADSLQRAVTITYATDASTNVTFDQYDSIQYPGTGQVRTAKVHYCYLDPGLYGKACPRYTGASTQTYGALFG